MDATHGGLTPRALAGKIPVYCAYTDIVDIDTLTENPRNPNRHPEKQLKLLAKLIQHQGWRQPITVSNRSGFIVRGHGRLQAARLAGVDKVPIDRQDYATEADEWADLVADNKIAELADTDEERMKELVKELAAQEYDLELMAVMEREADRLLNDDDTDGNEKFDPGKTLNGIVKPVTQPGDLWTLGGHRLLCGDSTDPGVIDRLMAGKKASMVFTDPPYGVSYEAQSGKFEQIANDELTGDQLATKLLIPAFRLMAAHTFQEAAFYIWHASTTRKDYEYAMTAAGLIEHQYLIWSKGQIVLGHAHYHWMHEPCFYASKEGQSPAFYGDRTQTTVWTATPAAGGDATTIGTGIILMDGRGGSLYLAQKAPKNKRIRTVRLLEGQTLKLQPDSPVADLWEIGRDQGAEHPTQKPVALAQRAILNSSRPGEIVLDSFLGSGSTLIGAEATGRVCYGAELDPRYCDVIIKRWEAFTGGKAQKVKESGKARTETDI
jgi:DNA modification methylase